ncbi:MAG: ATP-binding protein [Proteobacteria bacterium]|nr:MAG: ATP-binding protein [Pseudomonadota bacterium]
MPKKFFKRYSPDPKRIKETPGLGFLGERLHQPNLWHFNRHSVSKAFAIGLFCCWIPLPFQTVIAACLALYFRANLALSVALVFLTNPVTIPPVFYFAYRLGNWILGGEGIDFSIELSWDWLVNSMGLVWQPLFLGCLLSGIFTSMLGYLTVQLIWRQHIRKHQKLRLARPANQKPKSGDIAVDKAK